MPNDEAKWDALMATFTPFKQPATFELSDVDKEALGLSGKNEEGILRCKLVNGEIVAYGPAMTKAKFLQQD